MIHKEGKAHEHEVLYKYLQDPSFYWDSSLDDLLEKNRRRFEEDFRKSIKYIYFPKHLREYIKGLTNLERYFFQGNFSLEKG